MEKIAELVKEFRENINDLDVNSETKEMMTVEFFRFSLRMYEKVKAFQEIKKGECTPL